MKHAHLSSRRQFLRSAATMVAAGAVAPSLMPVSALGANERIGVGFVGIGRQASDLLRNILRQKDAKFVAVADVNLKRAEAAASKNGAVAYQDYRKLLERKDVDAIVTATPEHWRSLICIHACQAEKDIYAEKPMTLTIREGRLIVEAVRKYKRVFQTGSQQRSMWQNALGCELVREGAFGKIKRVIAYNYPTPWENGLPAQPIPEGLNWDMWCGPTEPVPFNQDLYIPRANPGWLSFRPYSGGEMTGWGAHGFDQVQWALAMDNAGPIEVWTEGPKFDPPKYTAAESKARGDKICSQPKVFFRYPGDIVMELGNGPMGGAVFIGDKGQITINRARIESDPPEIVEESVRNRPKGFQENHMTDWLEAIRARKKPIADVEIGHRSATVCHLGNIARWTGRRLKWDPVSERFPDDADANKLLAREHRKGYELPRTI